LSQRGDRGKYSIVFNLGMGEITVILLLALIFIGPSKLPELASGLGKLIREIRKATSDVKNEITLDESFRKPFEDLRDAVTLHPDELKRRDQLRQDMENAARRREEEAAQAERDALMVDTVAPALAPSDEASAIVEGPPGALFEGQPHVAAPAGLSGPSGTGESKANDTIVQPLPVAVAPAAPAPAAPLPVPVAAPAPVVAPPSGTVARGSARTEALPRAKPAAAAPPVAAPAPAPEVDRTNTTQILSEADLIPSGSSGRPPPPPHLPGLVRPPTPAPGAKSGPIKKT
jgi:sec-independent protein translocase protein TatB